MKIFGNKEEFAIEFNPYLEQYADNPDVIAYPDEYILGGNVCFWVKGKNLFAFKDWGPNATYGYFTLEYLVDFLSDFLIDQLSNVDFPIKTKATNAIDILEEVALVKSDAKNELEDYIALDWDNINMDERNKIEAWIAPRTFLGNRAGTFLPNIIARRINDKIEISWHNRHPHDDGDNKFYFLHKKGVEYISINLYKDVIIKFCSCYIKHIEKKEPELALKFRINLEKVINFKL